jgi:hypothetical protein
MNADVCGFVSPFEKRGIEGGLTGFFLQKRSTTPAQCHVNGVIILRGGQMEKSKQRSREEILQIAKAQKGVIWCVAVNILLVIFGAGFVIWDIQKGVTPFQSGPTHILNFLWLVTLPLLVYFICKLTDALKWEYPVL